MKRTSAIAGSLFLPLLFSSKGHAQQAPTESTSVYVDMYYSYNFNKPEPTPGPKPVEGSDANYAAYRGSPSGGTRYRNFDVQSNQFTLALAELSYKKTVGDSAVKVDFDFGDTADMTNNTGKGVDEVGKHIGQAVVSYTPSDMKALTINIGKMPTHMGYEVTKAKDNWQYSRSYLYAYAIPYWHTGVNVNLNIIPDMLSSGIFVYNGWNNMYENNRGKTLGLQLAYSPLKALTVTYNGIGGPEQEDNEKAKKIVHDVIVTLSVSEQVALSSDCALGSEENAVANATDPAKKKTTAKWSACQIALKYSPTARAYLSPRLETYSDRDGWTTGTSAKYSEVTLTAGWKATDQLETRLEARHDVSDKDVFVRNSDPVKDQNTLTWSVLYTL